MPRCCSTRAIEPAIADALDAPARRRRRCAERLRARGLARAREFTWERTARLTLESYAARCGADADVGAGGLGAA